MAQMEEQNKTSEKELNKMEIAKLSDAEFKTLVNRMLQQLTEYSNNIKEEMKVTLSEIQKNLRGNNSEGKEARIQINDLEHKEEINIHLKQNEKEEFRKTRESLRRLWDISKHTNICIIGMPEGEKEEQEIEKLFEKIMKENFPNLVKEIDIEVQEGQRVPNKMDTNRTTPRNNHN